MKVYIAASFVAQKRLRPIRDKLWSLGHEVVGSWLDEVARPEGMSQEIFDKQLAIKDLTEVAKADCIILDTTEESTTGGRMVEWGYALGQAKLRYLVGKPHSIFEHLADRIFSSWEEVYTHFSEVHKSTVYVATGMDNREFS